MNSATIHKAADSSSPTKLAPETIRVRNALIEKFSDQPIEELNAFLQRTLEVETDELKRLGLLAARVHILRQKVLNLKIFIRDETMATPRAVDLRRSQYESSEENLEIINESPDEVIDIKGWQSLEMIEPGEINGVRFFKGTVINAKSEDADKLISSGKAIVIDDEGNPIDSRADQSIENIGNSTDLLKNKPLDNDDVSKTLAISSDIDDGPTTTEMSLNEKEIEESLKQVDLNNESDEEPTTKDKFSNEKHLDENKT